MYSAFLMRPKGKTMEIRKARFEDLDRIMEIYAHARRFMAEHGNPRQWGATQWPPRELIQEDIRGGKSYVCLLDGRIIAVFYYDLGPDDTYFAIYDGCWKDDTPYGVVHRIASDGSVKGAGSFCVNWAFEQCGHLRMDTHGDNTVMKNLLTKLDFELCGVIYVKEDNDPRYAYEKCGQTL